MVSRWRDVAVVVVLGFVAVVIAVRLIEAPGKHGRSIWHNLGL